MTIYPPEAKELAHGLYLQGLGPAVICTELAKRGHPVPYPTLNKWIQRHGWHSLKNKTIGIMSVTQQPRLTTQVAERSMGVRSALAGELATLADQLNAKPARTLKQALKRQAELEPAVRNADKVFGWSKEGAETTMTVSQIETTAPTAERSPIELDKTTVNPPQLAKSPLQVRATQDSAHSNNYVQSVEVPANQASVEAEAKA